MTTIKTRRIIGTFLSFLLFALFAYFNNQPKVKTVSAQEAEVVPVACIADGLIEYMNAIIEGTRDLKNIKLLSPAFNMTNPAEFDIFMQMKIGKRAKFEDLYGFTGNTYTLQEVPAYDWFSKKYNWIGEMGGAYPAQKIIFTEYGDFDTWKLNDAPTDKFGMKAGSWGEVQANMTTEFNRAASNPQIEGINYFGALPGNPEFKGHLLPATILQGIVASEPKNGGINSALQISGGGFQDQVAGTGAGLGWTTEIVYNEGDVRTAQQSVARGYQLGMRTVIRICSQQSCAFSDPAVYIQFLRTLDQLLTGIGPAYVIAGPNEPATERWATPECRVTKEFKLEEVECTDTRDPEYHSLRPYPTSPCIKESTLVKMCANDLTVQEKVSLNANGSNDCTPLPDGGKECRFAVTSTSRVTFGWDRVDLPIVGNTELVPNAVSSPSDAFLSFAKRMNEYASWYLNGVISRAEEKFFTAPEFASDIIDFSGPIRKLLPSKLQVEERQNEVPRIGSERHDQIVSCGDPKNPGPCYSEEQSVNRLRSVSNQIGNQYTPSFSYIPFTTTTDLLGRADATGQGVFNSEIKKATFEVTSDSTHDLFYAHMQEVPEAANFLQKTYTSGNFVENGNVIDGKAPINQWESQNNPGETPYCEILETETNPGDKLYGDLIREGSTKTRMTGIVNYEAEFVCQFGPETVDNDALENCLEEPNSDYQTCLERSTRRPDKCVKDVSIPIRVDTFTPNAYTIWDKMVAGSYSIFKRMFPKTGDGSPILEIKDIPAESNANYQSTSTSFVGQGATLDGNTALAGNPYKMRPGSSANVYFPHLGSVKTYFLEGIQKALKPKGGGLPDTIVPGQCAQINCNKNAPPAPAKYAALKTRFVDLANRITGGVGENYADVCFNDVVDRSLKKGINPAFTLTIWLHESGASNYGTQFGCTIKDFGVVGGGVPAADFAAQITRFLDLPAVYKGQYPGCYTQGVPNTDYKGQEEMLAFNHIFLNGPSTTYSCTDPLDDTYYKSLVGMWNWIVPSCTRTGANGTFLFSITRPQDMSCP